MSDEGPSSSVGLHRGRLVGFWNTELGDGKVRYQLLDLTIALDRLLVLLVLEKGIAHVHVR